jgi:hypothetical protein
MPKNVDNRKLLEAIRLRAQELASDNEPRQHLSDAEALAALTEGTISFEEINQEDLDSCIKSFGVGSVIDALSSPSEWQPLPSEPPSLFAAQIKPALRSPAWYLRAPWIAAAASVIFAATGMFFASRTIEQTQNPEPIPPKAPAAETRLNPPSPTPSEPTVIRRKTMPKPHSTVIAAAQGVGTTSRTTIKMAAGAAVSGPRIRSGGGYLFGRAGPFAVPRDGEKERARLDERHSAQLIRDELATKYLLAKPTPVFIVRKGTLAMVPGASPTLSENTYADGRIAPSATATVGPEMRYFSEGASMRVTKIDLHDGEIVFSLVTTPVSGVSYKGALKFPVSADYMEVEIADVFTIQPSDGPTPPSLADDRSSPPKVGRGASYFTSHRTPSALGARPRKAPPTNGPPPKIP